MNKNNVLYTVIAALLLAVVALVFFAPADFQGKVLQQADIQQGLANGQEIQHYKETTGETAHWTNSLFSGMPTFQISPSYSANKMLEWVTKVYTLWLPSPANLLFALMLGFFILCLCLRMKWPVALFGAVAWGFSTYFIIIIGAGHIWKFLTLAYIPPMIGGVALCYRGKYWYGAALTALFAALQVGSNHPQMTYYFLFVIAAMVIAWLVTAIKESKIRQWIIATVCIIGAGGLGVAANMASLYMSYEYSKETIRGKATDIIIEGQPPVEEGLSHDYITQWSYGVDETLTLLIPNIKGGATVKPVGGDMMPRSMLDTETMQSSYLSPQEQYFAYNFMQYFGDQPMTNGPVYVGAFVLLLAILAMFIVDGPVMGPMKWALFAVSILAILLAWGHNFDSFTTFFIDNVPLYNKFRTPSSMLVVVEFCVPLLAAMAVIKMIRTPHFMRSYGTVFYAVSGILAFICFLGWVAPGTFGSPWSVAEQTFLRDNQLIGRPEYANVLRLIEESRLTAISQDSMRSLLFILLGFGVCFAFLKGKIKSNPLFACALTAIVLIDLFTVNKRYVDNDNFTDPSPSMAAFEPNAADLEILKDTTANYRVYDANPQSFNEARSSYFHKTIGGYHAAKLTRYNDLLSYRLDPKLYQNTLLNPESISDSTPPRLPGVINMLNPRYIMLGEKVYKNPGAYGNAWLVEKVNFVNTPNQEMEALDSLPLRKEAVADRKFLPVLGSSAPLAPGDTIYEVGYAPGRLDYEVNTHTGGVAVFSEVYFPWGWEATVDGQPVEIGRVNYVLRALKVPSGKHHIRFEFKPQRLEATNTLGVISVALIYLLCLIALALCGYRIWKGNGRLKKNQNIKEKEAEIDKPEKITDK